MLFMLSNFSGTKSLADLGGAWGTHAPPGHPNSFDFMQFLGKFGVFTPPLEGSRPPPRENPGSATENISNFVCLSLCHTLLGMTSYHRNSMETSQELVVWKVIFVFFLRNMDLFETRMHFSRMRTAHLLPVSPSMHCSGGCTCWGVYLPRGVYLPIRCTCPGVYLSRGLYLPIRCTCPGVYLSRGVYCPEGVPAQGMYLPRGWGVPAHRVGVYLPRGWGCTCPGTPPLLCTDRHV